MSSIRWTSPKSALPSVNAAASRRILRWARKRQGGDAVRARLEARRIYILPTAMGLVYAVTSFVMLLGSMNYNNNLSFGLTFLLVGVGLVAMHACQRNLVGLDVDFAGTDPVFAGQSAQFRFAIGNRSRNARFRLTLRNETTDTAAQDIPAGESRLFTLPVPTTQRGWVRLDRYGIRSTFPFELFRAWAWLHMDIRGLVYPEPANHAPPPPASQSALGHRQHDARGEEDFAGLRKFHPGDSPRNVAWKAYARSDQLLSKQFAGADTSSQWFDFESVEADDLEQRLSILTRWVIDADRKLEDYGLKMPGVLIAPGHGEAHRHACLEALALFGLEDTRGQT
ncbi:MAG: DUF58 domain-containing protein [Pseudomonadota bacterium]